MDRPPLGPSLVIALFVAVAWAAASFAVAGLLAVLLDRDPVQSSAPPWVGLVGLAAASGAVWSAILIGIRARAPWLAAIAAAAGVYLIIVSLALLGSFGLFVEQASSPFVLATAALAAAAVIATHFAVRRPPDTGLPPDDARP